MKIAVLDARTLDRGDISWQAVEKLGTLARHEHLTPEAFQTRLGDVPLILTNKIIIDAGVMDKLPALRYIGVLATGYNNIDIAAAGERGIVVCNVPAYSTSSVAQMVFAYILHFSQQVALHSKAVKEGGWARSPEFCFWEKPLAELKGQSLGIVGYGAIGKQVARLARAFDMRVLVHTRRAVSGGDDRLFPVDRDTLFRQSDFLSLHCPLTEDTREMVNERTLSLMKQSAVLINTGRGGLIDEGALDKALRARRLRAAALDVLGMEPPPPDHPLVANPHTLITPHIAWATRQARQRLVDMAAENIRAFLEGTPQNRLV
ncbi:MAG TPA: D-2-hydroxyacid dehydrogenase [Caldithrix abyssi]|uniref:D-2-hydroxyacid dehydrogenase n=1 Tax=Caldithrix abyssi TaxID=187145 RepID=A0A7V1PTW3_CALAY|nr:D-2-hydroxyacid dehydrogenase [Caldithrix abyssi]